MNAEPARQGIDAIIARRSVLVTCGTGGVGKTTLSAALGIRAALAGRKTVVVTIDPAKRLKTSLGLPELGDQPTDLTAKLAEIARAHGKTEVKGSLAAIVPDTRHTFETFVNNLAPDSAAAQRILKNPIFEIFAREFSGANEYMALERLYSLCESKEFDCIILDTPPSRNTLAFLNAPRLLARFFEEKIIRWLVLPTNQIVSLSMRKALGLLERLTGPGFMTHLLDFAAGLFEMQENFKANLGKVMALLESDRVGFLMVTMPTPDSIPELRQFIDTLRGSGLHFDGLAVNRTLTYLGGSVAPADEGERVVAALQAREQRVLERLTREPPPYAVRLPELARDVHSLEDLFHVAMAFDSTD
jgi:anion-transporting  ArsA/GET3 family ATPase